MSDENYDWIAKYRAAISIIPIQQSRVDTFTAKLKEIIQQLVSAIGRASHRETTAQLGVKPFEELCCPSTVQVAASGLKAQSRSEESRTKSSGKRAVGESQQRRAG